jgi:molecular chaperone IbpA
MTVVKSQIDPSSFANLSRVLIGFDRLRSTVTNNYPPYNIIRYNESSYAIEVAVAGFSKAEITVQVSQNQLSIRGEHSLVDDTNIEYLHRGLAARNFEQSFTLAEYMIVSSGKVNDGLLKIDIERAIPKIVIPRQIEIT